MRAWPGGGIRWRQGLVYPMIVTTLNIICSCQLLFGITHCYLFFTINVYFIPIKDGIKGFAVHHPTMMTM